MGLKTAYLLVALCVTLALCQDSGCGSLPDQKDPELAERANSIFLPLSPNETQQIIEYLMGREELNLVPAHNATLTSNYIYTIENFIPPKSEVTSWLDGKRERLPMRIARVILFMGETNEVKDILVSPIPNPTFHYETQLNRKNGNEISWRSRPVGAVEGRTLGDAIFTLLEPMHPTLNKMVAEYCEEYFQCGTLQYQPRAAMDSTLRHFAVYFTMSPMVFRAYYVLPVPVEMVIYLDEDDELQVREIHYNDDLYDSIEKLVDDLEKNPEKQVVLPAWNDDLGQFGTPDFIEEDNTADDTRRPPAQFYPDGQRFRVDGHHVEWLKWSFDLHTRTIGGQQMFDVRFNGERIAYELSIQDIIVLYSGTGTGAYTRAFIDSGFGIGRLSSSLVRGVDCPEGSHYLDILVYLIEFDDNQLIPDAVCVFEHRNSVPIRRHYSADNEGSYRFAFSMPDTVLIVRQILTISNYDYIYDFELHQNGVIEAKVSSTGYIQVANNIADGETRYGILLEPSWKNVGLFHQHLFNFRFDLDVGGTCNRFKTVNFGSEKVRSQYANGEAWYVPTSNETLIEFEQDAKVRYDFSKPKQYVVYQGCGGGTDIKHGYKISSNGFNKLVLPDDSPLIKGALSWSKYQVAVTQYHEMERGTLSYFTHGDPARPDVNFDEFIADNERIVDKDLVVWVTVGIHHLPTNEDMPVTTTPGKTLVASMSPFNFFVRDPSINSRDGAVFYNVGGLEDDYLHLNDTCEATVLEPSIYTEERPLEEDYEDYDGEVSTSTTPAP